MIDLKVKKLHPDAIIPTYATDGSACFDLYAAADCVVGDGDKAIESSPICTGLSFEIPQGWQMLIFSRSGHGFKQCVRLVNCVGVIDSDYRGEVKVKLVTDSSRKMFRVHKGARIAQAQLMPVHRVSFTQVDELSTTERGTGGFGSTGK